MPTTVRPPRRSDVCQTAGGRLGAISGFEDAAGRESALKAGFDDHFTSPMDPAAPDAILADKNPGPGQPECRRALTCW